MTVAARRHRLASIALVLVTAAACGGDDSGESAPDGEERSTSEPDQGAGSDGDGSAPGAASEDEPYDESARFRWANAVGLTRFDPHRATSSNDNTHLFLTYDRLVHQDDEGNPVPGLAESWEFADDGTVLELDLREDVTFHDGEPFDAEAAKANIERARSLDDSAVAPELESIETVQADGQYDLRLGLSEPNAALPLILSDRAGAMISPEAFDNPDLDEQPVGAGMFEVTEYAQGASITYDAYDDYWDTDAVRVAGIDMVIHADSSTRFNALRDGQVDATVLAPDQVDQAQGAGLEVMSGQTNNYWYFQPNRARSEFGDVRVRQALWHAIDRQALIDSLAEGHAELSAQPVPDWSFAHNPDIAPDYYEYDPDRARELLADAGLEDGFSFEALVSTGTEVQQHAEVIQSQLAEVGIDMEIRIMEGDQITDVFFTQEEGDLLMGPGGGRPDPAQTTGLRYTPGGFMNAGDHTTDEIERLQEEVEQTIDEDERAARFGELMQEIVDEAAEVILYFAAPPVGMSEDVVSFNPLLADRPEFRGVSVNRS